MSKMKSEMTDMCQVGAPIYSWSETDHPALVRSRAELVPKVEAKCDELLREGIAAEGRVSLLVTYHEDGGGHYAHICFKRSAGVEAIKAIDTSRNDEQMEILTTTLPYDESKPEIKALKARFEKP